MRKYTTSHEWVELNEGVGTVGITDHAQEELGDIVHVELPEKGQKFSKGDDLVVLESTKAAADVYAPLSGTVLSVNTDLLNAPELVNQKAEHEGWLFTMQVDAPEEMDALLSKEDYDQQVKGG